MRPFVREVLHSIQGHLVHIATQPPTEGGPGASKAGGPGGVKVTTMGAFLPATDDRYGGLPAVLCCAVLCCAVLCCAVMLSSCLSDSNTDLAAHCTAPHRTKTTSQVFLNSLCKL